MKAENIVNAVLSSYINNENYDGEAVTSENIAEIEKISVLQRLSPVIFDQLYKCGKLDIGQNDYQRIKNDCIVQCMLQEKKTAFFLKIYKIFLENGIKPLCVKGIICRNLWRVPSYRTSCDEDMLVSAADFPVCEKILLENGFILVDNGNPVVSYEHKNGCRIELHKSLFQTDKFDTFNSFFENAFENPDCVMIKGTEIYTLKPNLHLLYLVFHAFKHFLAAGIGIRQLSDIALFIKKYTPDIDFVREKCGEISADGFFDAILNICKEYFGLDIDVATVDIQPLLDDIYSGGVYGGIDDERHHSSHITSSGYNKQNTIKNILFPPLSHLKSKYTYLEKYPILAPIAYISRILSYLIHGSSLTALKYGNERKKLLKLYKII